MEDRKILVVSDCHFGRMDGYKLPSGMVIIERGTRGDYPLPGGHMGTPSYESRPTAAEWAEVMRDLPVSEFSDAIRADYADRLLGDYAIPMPEHSVMHETLDTLSKAFGRDVIEEEVHGMMRSPFFRETHDALVTYRLEAEDRKITAMAPMFIPDDRHNGAPRSIRETMRRHRPGKHKRNKGRGR